MPDTGINRQHDVFCHVAGEAYFSYRYRAVIFYIHNRFRVGDAGRAAQHNWRIELLADFEGVGHQVVGGLAVRGFEDRHFGQFRVVPVVLFSLRAVDTGVVGFNQNKSGIDTGGRDC